MRHPLFPPQKNKTNPSRPDQKLDLDIDIRLPWKFYMDNTIYAYTDQFQFKVAGWNYSLGVDLMEEFSFEYEHESTHRLDSKWGNGFYFYDSIGVKIKVYER